MPRSKAAFLPVSVVRIRASRTGGTDSGWNHSPAQSARTSPCCRRSSGRRVRSDRPALRMTECDVGESREWFQSPELLDSLHADVNQIAIAHLPLTDSTICSARRRPRPHSPRTLQRSHCCTMARDRDRGMVASRFVLCLSRPCHGPQFKPVPPDSLRSSLLVRLFLSGFRLKRRHVPRIKRPAQILRSHD